MHLSAFLQIIHTPRPKTAHNTLHTHNSNNEQYPS